MKLPVNYDKITGKERRLAREEYIRVQNGNCYFCKGKLTDLAIEDRKVNVKLFPDGFFNYPVHLHHDHNTGMTLGAVHAYCNAVLWQYYGE